MSRRLLPTVLGSTALLAVLALSGCASNDSGTITPPKATTTVPGPTTTRSGGGSYYP